MTDERINREIAHGKFLRAREAEKIWNWSTPAGRIRLERRRAMLRSVIQVSMSVLEVGCGTGLFTKGLVDSQARITAIDISPDLLEAARASLEGKNVAFEIRDACNTSFQDKNFDAVVGSSVLHHLAIDKALPEIFRVLKPGGKICFTEPNLLNPQVFAMKKIPPLKRLLGESPDETAFVRGPLAKRLKDTGFDPVVIAPFDFLHPSIPAALIPIFRKMGEGLEKIPLIKEIAGSLLITAEKPA